MAMEGVLCFVLQIRETIRRKIRFILTSDDRYEARVDDAIETSISIATRSRRTPRAPSVRSEDDTLRDDNLLHSGAQQLMPLFAMTGVEEAAARKAEYKHN